MNIEKNPTACLTIDFLGPTIEFLTSPEDEQNEFCVQKAIIAPGGFVPLHSHADIEDFVVLSGELQVLRRNAQGDEWITAKAGDYIHVPGGVPHAWRNVGSLPLVNLVIATRRLGQFLLEAGRPAVAAHQSVTPEDVARLANAVARYGYWMATPEENAAVGIRF
jgi:quercetin dioxygenase-like cupin family protein